MRQGECERTLIVAQILISVWSSNIRWSRPTISLEGIANSNLPNSGHILLIFLRLSFPTPQFPKLIFCNVPPNAFNMSSIHRSGIFVSLSASRMDKEWREGEEGRRTSVRRRERREVELGGTGVETWVGRESIQK